MTFSKVQKKGMGYERKNDDGEIKACLGAWFGHIQVQEKKERKKDSPYPKKGGERESHTKKRGLHTKIHKISTHLHILIRLHDLFLLGSSFWLRNIWKGSMPLHPYPELHRSLIRVGEKEGITLSWWEFSNTKRDSREQFEEQSYLLFQK
jgi:hypothetical protein